MLLEVNQVDFSYDQKKVLHNVSFAISSKEVLAIVGDSGCGKSTLVKIILGSLKPQKGSVRFKGVDLYESSKKEIRSVLRNIQVIFQNVDRSLNPKRRADEIIEEPLKLANKKNQFDNQERVRQMALQVGLPINSLSKYPHAFSGGQKQRIAIARAMITQPSLLICDEATSSLDVSIQAQIIRLLKDSVAKQDQSMMFITHDLALAKWISTRILVMWNGRIVEEIMSIHLLSHAIHPYTKLMISSLQFDKNDLSESTGQITEGSQVKMSHDMCGYAFKCKEAKAVCFSKRPELIEVSKHHKVACFNFAIR